MAALNALPRWSDRWLALRDRLLGSARFVRWASAFPLTRPIARRRARALFDLVAGFVYSQTLLACVRLRLFDHLADGPLGAAALAHRMGLTPAAAATLLDAAAALELVEPRGADRYGLGPLGGALRANPGVVAMIEHHALVYRDLADPVALLRREGSPTELSRFWGYAGVERPAALDPAITRTYSALMSASQQLIAHEILDAYPLRSHRCLLDVGGGEGTFLIAAAARAPHLRMMLFDLPPVAERARVRFAERGLADRAEAHGGDFRQDNLPGGADVVSLIRVAFDHADDTVLAVLRAARGAMAPGTTLLLAEPMAGTRGAEPVGAAYFGWYLWAMGPGRPRSPAQLSALMEQAGFVDIRVRSTRNPLQVGLLVGTAGVPDTQKRQEHLT
jgi:demethylspheroidene O-methyltransferase